MEIMAIMVTIIKGMEDMVATIILVTTMDMVTTTVRSSLGAWPSLPFIFAVFLDPAFIDLQINPVDMASHHGVVVTPTVTSPIDGEALIFKQVCGHNYTASCKRTEVVILLCCL